MPQPHNGQVHVDRPLTNISTAYIQKDTSFIADKVFPTVPVAKKSDTYFKYSKNDFLRLVADVRAPATESAGGGYNLSTGSYNCDVIAVHKDIDEQIRANADAPLDMDRDATIWVTQQCLLKREVDFASNYFVTGVWTTHTEQSGVASDSPGANQFEQWDRAGSTPITDVTEQSAVMLAATGYLPNTLVISYATYIALKNHADIIDRVKYNYPSASPAMVTEQMLAQVFDLERVLVAKAVRNTSNEGNATQTVAAILGKSALLCHSAANPGLLTPSAGYTFAWTGLLGAGATGARIKRLEVPLKEAQRIEAEMAYDQAIIATDLGVFFNTVVG